MGYKKGINLKLLSNNRDRRWFCSICKTGGFLRIPANFFSVKCVRFFVFTESEFRKIYQRLPKIAEDFGSLPKNAEGSERLPKISRRLPKITKGKERFSTSSKQGQQQFPKDFQPISRIIKKFRRCSDDFLNVKKQLNFYLIGF